MSNVTSEEKFIELPNGRIFAQIWTPENAEYSEPIILLHDSLGSVSLWRDFPEKLAAHLHRPVIAYDRLGFGQSSAREAIPSPNFVTEEAELTFPVIKQRLELQQYILLGHSVGGGMSIEIAARDRDCIAVITEAAQAFVEDRTVKGIQDAKAMFERPGQVERLAKYHGDKAEWVLHAWTDVWLSEAFSTWSVAESIKKVTCPLLAIHGDNDEYGSRAFPEFLTERAGGPSRMVMLAECGHVPHKEKQDDVLLYIANFLQRNRLMRNHDEKIKALYNKSSARYGEMIQKTGYSAPAWLLENIKPVISKENLTLLDVGCANGINVKNLAELNPSIKAIGLDISQGMVSAAEALNLYQAVHCHSLDDGLSMFDDDSFECILALGCLEFMNKIDYCLAEVGRVCKPNGTLFASFQEFEQDKQFAPRQSYSGDVVHFAYSVEEVQEMLNQSGFIISKINQQTGYTGGFPCPYIFVIARKSN